MLGITAAGFTAFALVSRYLPIFQPEPARPGAPERAAQLVPAVAFSPRVAGKLDSI